jgi:hypothetical protein
VRKEPLGVPWEIWIALGAVVFSVGGPKVFALWLLPGVPPPGPFG